MSNYIMNPYDNMLKNILDNGQYRDNRTGMPTLSIFGVQSRFNIRDRFPILTARKMYPKSVFAELLWIISGSTNNNDLERFGCKFWRPWVDNAFEKKHGYKSGDFGPIYGYQLRNFGGDYYKLRDPNGFDQLKYVIDEIKSNPLSRRILINLWNPKDLDIQRLPCCHYSFQIYIYEDTISGMLTQRSADVPIGSPANIQFYSALLYMIGQQTGYTPLELIYSIGDAHIYTNQIERVKEYLCKTKNCPDSPIMKLNKAKDIYSYNMEDFIIEDYYPLETIKIPVMV
ncbi:MAG: Thymidylate synthase [Promethearchaeota archaeon]|nr:MAG: Thymidylate synthase [Candidatus Lokiarchaeota archaeon]